mmetsp:Transcript_30493/g.93220  ORF Transcript_30493/g.93220 Transcript_30493/m.93220 type:complete len:219 (-) Transcript_30493:107-763(-)|eukprot:scaffold270272_cov23-Tisochrysis_lutea.AAC.2
MSASPRSSRWTRSRMKRGMRRSCRSTPETSVGASTTRAEPPSERDSLSRRCATARCSMEAVVWIHTSHASLSWKGELHHGAVVGLPGRLVKSRGCHWTGAARPSSSLASNRAASSGFSSAARPSHRGTSHAIGQEASSRESAPHAPASASSLHVYSLPRASPPTVPAASAHPPAAPTGGASARAISGAARLSSCVYSSVSTTRWELMKPKTPCALTRK